jgi:hypothetical protein
MRGIRPDIGSISETSLWKLSPHELSLFIRAAWCDIFISSLPYVLCKSALCSVLCRQPLCNAQALDFILPPILGTAEVTISNVRRLYLTAIAHAPLPTYDLVFSLLAFCIRSAGYSIEAPTI